MKILKKGKSGNIRWSFRQSVLDESYSKETTKIIPSFFGRVNAIDNVDGVIRAEGILTHSKGVFVLKTADCIPVIVFWPNGGMVGVLHLHIKGLFLGLVNDFDRKIKKFCLPIEKCHLVFGPSICPKCYTHTGLLRKIKWQVLRGKCPKLVFRGDRDYIFDLQKAYLEEFLKIGVQKNNIEILSGQYCTNCKLGISRHHRIKDKYIYTILENE